MDCLGPLSEYLLEQCAAAVNDEGAAESPYKHSRIDEDTTTLQLPQPTDVIDPVGDLLLRVGTPGPDQVRFKVSSHAMSMACPAWRAMLDRERGFQESITRTIDFEEDDPTALRVVLMIAHLQFASVPDHLTIPELYRAAVLCDKYFLKPLTAIFLESWLKIIQPAQGVEEAKFMYGPPDPKIDKDIGKKVMISWFFRRQELFTFWAYIMITHTRVDELGRLLDSTGVPLPDEIPGDMASLRQRSLDRLLIKQRSWFKKLKGNSECSGGPSWHTTVVCDNIAYGIAARALDEAGVFPIPEDSAKVTMTFRRLSKLHYDIGHAIKATPPQVAGDCNHWFNQSSLWDSLQKHSKWKKWKHISELKQ